MFEETNNIFEAQVDELFSTKSESDINLILRCFGLFLTSNSHNVDILELYRLLDLENFVRVITLFDGRTITFPTVEKLKDMLLLSLSYYYREIKGYSWDKIKTLYPYDISTVSYGIRIKSLDTFIKQKLEEIFREEKKNG